MAGTHQSLTMKAKVGTGDGQQILAKQDDAGETYGMVHRLDRSSDWTHPCNLHTFCVASGPSKASLLAHCCGPLAVSLEPNLSVLCR